VELYTAPPPGSTVICADELGPVIPRTFPPAPGWSPGGHRVKAPLEYSRGPEKTWVYGGLRVADGQAVTMCAPSRNSTCYQDFLQLEEQANPDGTIWVITGNLSSHDSKSTRAWLEDHPRIRHAFIPKRACWLNMQEGWWRIFRRHALAGQDFADPDEIARATQVATAQLNAAPGPGSGDDPSPSHGPTADALYTSFKELSIKRLGHVCGSGASATGSFQSSGGAARRLGAHALRNLRRMSWIWRSCADGRGADVHIGAERARFPT
jgi:hypothetical protein